MLYHLTTEANAERILKTGLKPRIGKNSAIISEEIPRIYLCEWKDVPKWSMLLNRHVLLAIDNNKAKLNTGVPCKYRNYSEYMSDEPIAAKYIKRVNMPRIPKTAINQLALSYVINISRFCVQCAELYNDYYNLYYDTDYELYQEKFDCTFKYGQTVLTILKRLNYNYLKANELKKELEDITDDGEYTIYDKYLNTDLTLHQQLIYYPTDQMSTLREKLYEEINRKFRHFPKINTGITWS
ncbi:hypothetical protein J6A31_08940 [bacterium]|nr:hypothetical protein [bacterium]